MRAVLKSMQSSDPVQKLWTTLSMLLCSYKNIWGENIHLNAFALITNDGHKIYNDGCKNSIAVGVQAPRINLSNSFVNPAPFPLKLNIEILEWLRRLFFFQLIS